MAFSKTAICNLALRRIGAQRIESVTDDSKEARLCNEFYEISKESVLRSHPWNCAIARATLAASVITPNWGYGYQYPLPVDCLRVLQMAELSYEFRVEGRMLLTNENECEILYIDGSVSEGEFDALLVRVIYLTLALNLATALRGEAGGGMVKEIIEELERIALPLARSIDAQECSLQEFETQTWLNARR